MLNVCTLRLSSIPSVSFPFCHLACCLLKICCEKCATYICPPENGRSNRCAPTDRPFFPRDFPPASASAIFFFLRDTRPNIFSKPVSGNLSRILFVNPLVGKRWNIQIDDSIVLFLGWCKEL